MKDSLKLLVGDIVDFVREDWNPWAYAYAFLYVSFLVFAFYGLGWYEKIITPMYQNGNSWWGMPVWMMITYFGVAIPNLLIRKDYARLRNPRFYIKAAAFIFLMGYSLGYQWYSNYIYKWDILYSDARYLSWCWIYVDGIFFVVLPLAIYKYLFDRKIDGVYGLCRRTRHVNVYLMALLCLLPFVIGASFLPDFQSYYPRFMLKHFEGSLGWPLWGVTSFFEVCYGSDFITTEVFFRGAMVIGMMAILGPRAVLPMCVMYCCAHFGKPILESCSAAFGGYLLGVLAYKTKHIWGGVCAHLGIAMMMELMGILHIVAKM